jgi:hypothetical protein
MPFSVFLLSEFMPVPFAELGKPMHKVLGGVAYDHMNAINANHGWVARKLDRDPAEQLVAELEAAGHKAILKDEEDLIGVKEVLKVRRAELSADALKVEVGLLGELNALSWDDLSLVSIGRVQVVTQKTVKTKKRKVGLSTAGLAMGVPVPTMKTTTTSSREKHIDENVLVQLVFAEEGVVREIRPNAFDYGYLGERRLPTGRQNLLLFLYDLTTFGKAATWTSMARAFAEEGEAPHSFKSQKDMLRYTQWQIEAKFDVAD